MTLFTLLILLMLQPNVSVVATPDRGPAPLHTIASFTVTGPYEGQVCVLITEDTAVVAKQCADDDVVVAAGETVTVEFPLVGKSAGTYVFHPVLPTGDVVVYGEGVKVVVEPGQ